MSRFESSRFVRNPQIMHVDVLKSACEALGWTYHVVSNELLVTDAKQVLCPECSIRQKISRSRIQEKGL